MEIPFIPSARGRRPTLVSSDFVRELTGADLDFILAPPDHGVKTPSLAKLKHSHHLLARLLAEGRPAVEASMITGYSQSRISILQHDPAFEELIAYYASQTEAKYLDVHERLAALGIDTIEELHERLTEQPEKFTQRELMELAELTLDRSIAPPKGGKNAGQAPAGASVNLTVQFVDAPTHPQLVQGTSGPSSPLVLDIIADEN